MDENDEVKIDLSPMIDVTFQLFIFFLLTINFKVQEGNLTSYLPKHLDHGPSMVEPTLLDEFRVTVRYDRNVKKTTVELSGDLVASWKNDESITPSERREFGKRSVEVYRSINNQAPDEIAPLKIDAKASAPNGRVIVVLDILKGHILDNPEFKDETGAGPRLMWTGNGKQKWDDQQS